MPDLFVIAGPNGAGKSTFSDKLVSPGLEIFDGDKELAILEKKFPEISPAQLQTVVAEDIFEGKKAQAINNGKDFAYETNFASSDVMKTTQEFRAAGYNIKLIYIGLPDTEAAEQRVGFRVRYGGHDVESSQIKSNYQDGLANLEKYIRYFDKVRVYDGMSAGKALKPKLIYTIEKGKILKQDKSIPKWARHLPLTPSQAKSNEQKKQRGRKR